MAFPPTRAAYEALIDEVKLLKEEVKQLRNEEKETSRSALDIELEPETRDRKASRNSWAEIYHNNTVRRKSVKLLGQDVAMDEWLDWRVKWGQRGVGASALLGLICHVAGLNIGLIVFGSLTIIFLGMVYYKNISFVIMKRLLREMNVIIILVLGFCNWVINIAIPRHSLSPVNGLLYMLVVCAIVFLDAIKVKSRLFAIVVGIIFVLVNANDIYHLIFGNWSQGVVLLEYTIQGNEYTFMKRSTQRSMFIQIMLFSMNGIYTLFKDKNMELMIFATGNIYRETGTASKEVEDKIFSMEIKLEKEKSIDQARV